MTRGHRSLGNILPDMCDTFRKSYIAMAYIEAHPDENILFITSYLTTLSRFAADCKKNISDAFSHLDLTIYVGLRNSSIYDSESLINKYLKTTTLSRKIYETGYDTIILDKFHRVGADIWEDQVKKLLMGQTAIGFSATPIRFLDNNRDMGKEIFCGNVVSEITLHDALVSQLLPTPQYITCRNSLWEDFVKAEGELRTKWMIDQEKSEAAYILSHARNFIQNAGGSAVFHENEKNAWALHCLLQRYGTPEVHEGREQEVVRMSRRNPIILKSNIAFRLQS